jgi:aspartate kinase
MGKTPISREQGWCGVSRISSRGGAGVRVAVDGASAGSGRKTPRTIVQKFGGSSVANAAKMRACAARAERAVRRGERVVVVVSAMGDATDDLIALAATVTDAPDKREMDQLLATGEQVSIALMTMTLRAMGIDAVSLTGRQCGMHTDELHTRARIQSVDRSRLLAELAQGRVPVVAGFQGVSPNGDVTTLGRGGSDTTAVAIAAAIEADECEIYTDVDGVYTTDPRIEPKARPLAKISYDEMMEAASQGARVMHLRSVELGKKAGVPIRVLHSQRPLDGPGAAGMIGGAGAGTLICDDPTTSGDSVEDRQAVSIVALKTDLGRVTLEDLPNRPGIQRDIFENIAKAGISVDDIIQHEIETSEPGSGEPGHQKANPGERCNIVFTLDKADLRDVTPIIETVLKSLAGGTALQSRAPRVKIDLGLVKVSAIGVGMQSQPGVAATMFRALADAGITIANITTSEIKISCILPEADGAKAVRVVHDAFGLGVATATTA